jgi:hypothetical protein
MGSNPFYCTRNRGVIMENWEKAFLLTFGFFRIIYYVGKHPNIGNTVWWVIKLLFKLLIFAGLYWLGTQFYSVTSGGAEGVVIAIIDVYYIISPYLYVKYASISKLRKGDESVLEDYGIAFVDDANFVIFEIVVIISGLVFYGIGMSIAWILGY